MIPDDFLHIAVGVIRNNRNQVLLSRRLSNVHQAGLWEFPGGKLEPEETVGEALSRELEEELAVTVNSAHPLIKIYHDYEAYSVLLDVWQVGSWDSDLLDNNGCYGRQGQKIEWVDISELYKRDFPEANKPIIKAVQLPEFYLICPEPEGNLEDYIKTFAACISAGVRLFQLRFSDDSQYGRNQILVTELLEMCRSSDSRLLMNSSPEVTIKFVAHGVHLNSRRLMQLNERPLDNNFLVAASCHNSRELEHACKIDVDFAVLSPVNRTISHQAAKPLGWDKFKSLVEPLLIPIYALGGMQAEDMEKSWSGGAQGISVLSGVWGQKSIKQALDKYPIV
ncbi:MAG: Nudix family hydrolase [Proteobacteria bacterium]|nr:Nudix family hydrolase [Pseudomonadota bacterium]MCH9047507.1 Nudix family hydrolase [Pseudomonadota bacterium]